MGRKAVVAAAGLLALTGTPATAGARPFSFLERPTDQLAVPGYVAGTTVTPEGSLYTGYAELVFRHGARLRPVDVPLRTLVGGRYPVVRAALRDGALRGTLTVLCTARGGRPVNLIRVELRNAGRRPLRATWAAALRHAGGQLKGNGKRRFRFPRPAEPERVGLYTQPGTRFDPDADWAFAPDAVTRDGEALLVLPPPPPGVRERRTLRPAGSRPVREDTELGRVTWRARLAPGERVRLDLAMPVVPVAPGSQGFAEVRAASFDAELGRVLGLWGDLYRRAIAVEVPERKVEDAFYASLANMVMPRYPAAEGGWVQAVNKLQYHSFWLRDAAVITHAFDLSGLHDLAAENLRFFAAWQREDGLYISRRDQYDGIGQALWSQGRHVALARSPDFARDALPAVRRAMAWLETTTAREPLGLLPAGTPGDNELATGHLVGDNLWALAGMRQAATLATAAGRDDLAASFGEQAEAFRGRLVAALREVGDRAGGRVPPTFEASGGEDWGNLWLAWPEAVLAPQDPLVAATMRRARTGFRGGIATYLGGRLLHHYLGFRVFQTDLARGDQRAALEGLYAELAHTTATHAGWETGVRRRGRRELDENLAPHGWWAAEYVTLLRSLLVREEGTDLVVLSALAPGWLRPGRTVALREAPTARGEVNLRLRALRGGAVLRWSTDRLAPGTRLRWPVPAWASAVRAPGLIRGGREILLPAAAGRIRVRWRLAPGGPSYAAAVRRVRALYGANP
jgi:hypothetical protein